MPLRVAHPVYWSNQSTLASPPDNPLTSLKVQLAHADAELSCVLLCANGTPVHLVRKTQPFSPHDAICIQTSRFVASLTINLALLPLEHTSQLRVFLSPSQLSHSTIIFSGTTATETHIPLGELHLPPLPSLENPHLELLRLNPLMPSKLPTLYQHILHKLSLQALPPVPFEATLPLTLTPGPVFYSPQQPESTLHLV